MTRRSIALFLNVSRPFRRAAFSCVAEVLSGFIDCIAEATNLENDVILN